MTMAEKEYIPREAALSAQNKSMNLAECRTRLERLPAADVAPVRHGHFGKYTSPFTAPCSECGTSMNTYWHYCPTCGARMDEEVTHG